MEDFAKAQYFDAPSYVKHLRTQDLLLRYPTIPCGLFVGLDSILTSVDNCSLETFTSAFVSLLLEVLSGYLLCYCKNIYNCTSPAARHSHALYFTGNLLSLTLL